MADTTPQQILNQLKDHEQRIRVLEGGTNGIKGVLQRTKEPTLSELIKNKNLKSGQQKVAVIVGYFEKIVRKLPIKEANLKEGWRAGKFDGKYNPAFLSRAIKDGLVRNIDGSLDLSQTGEKFLETFLNAGNSKTRTQE